MKDPRFVCRNLDGTNKVGITPNSQLVIRHTVARNKFAVAIRKIISKIYFINLVKDR